MANIYTKKICDKWSKDPLINPFRKDNKPLKISKTGIYAKLDKNCNKKKPVKVKAPRKQIVISDSQCEAFRKNPTINPITKRKLDINALNGVYSKLLKECDNKLETKAQILRARNAIRLALRPILNRMDTIENRIKFAGIVRKYTENIESCIKMTPAGSLVLMEKSNKGVIKEILNYDKRIGSDSVYGIAYSNMGKKMLRKVAFASKIMPATARGLTTPKKEIELLRRMSELVERNITPHMPITYKVVKCTKPMTITTANTKNVHNIIKDGNYFIVINELASSDLSNFLKKTYSDAVYESVLMQAIIAVRTFHLYTNHAHADTHWGNFLIHEIKPGGYWHYKLKGTYDVYVPNNGYLVVLWDPGLAVPITFETAYQDYARTIGVLSYKPNYIEGRIMPPMQILDKFNKNLNVSIERLVESLNHIKHTLPSRGVVINKIPYII